MGYFCILCLCRCSIYWLFHNRSGAPRTPCSPRRTPEIKYTSRKSLPVRNAYLTCIREKNCWVMFLYMRCQLDLSARIAGLISSVLFCVTFLIVFKQYPGLFFVRLSTTKHWWRSLSPIDHGFFEFCLYFVYVAFSVVHSSAATLSLKNS